VNGNGLFQDVSLLLTNHCTHSKNNICHTPKENSRILPPNLMWTNQSHTRRIAKRENDRQKRNEEWRQQQMKGIVEAVPNATEEARDKRKCVRLETAVETWTFGWTKLIS
jgi:hypothetical protein